MPTANDRQPGGDHYRAEYQHWDMVADVGLGYFTGNITKYLSRFRRKNGVQDLEKAAHYLQKLIELEIAIPREVPELSSQQKHNISRWVSVNRLPELDQLCVMRVVMYRSVEDLRVAERDIARLKFNYESETAPPLA